MASTNIAGISTNTACLCWAQCFGVVAVWPGPAHPPMDDSIKWGAAARPPLAECRLLNGWVRRAWAGSKHTNKKNSANYPSTTKPPMLFLQRRTDEKQMVSLITISPPSTLAFLFFQQTKKKCPLRPPAEAHPTPTHPAIPPHFPPPYPVQPPTPFPHLMAPQGSQTPHGFRDSSWALGPHESPSMGFLVF